MLHSTQCILAIVADATADVDQIAYAEIIYSRHEINMSRKEPNNTQHMNHNRNNVQLHTSNELLNHY